ncbi:MAG: SpoIIE family protein phosphatase [Burkholderiales bacterium]|nr:SpoIIE family protein phosphatase [Bacteroidia bacterium]
MGGFVLLLLLSVVIFKSYRNKKKANELISLQKQEVEKQKHTIEEKQKDILDSIHYAKRIQDALLKEEQHVNDHLPEHFVLFKPKDIISGDFYWALEKQDHLYLAAADCTGHGVPGAMMSMLGIAFLNEITGIEQLLSPAEILNRLRDKVVKELGSSGQTKDGMDISLCKINLLSGELEWAGANNPLWIISKRHCEVENQKQSQQTTEIASIPRNDGYLLTEIKPDKQPIGYSDSYKPFTNHTFTQKDCTYYLFTDGYADQFGGAKGKKFKYKPLQEKLINLSDASLDVQKTQLNTLFDEWKGDLEQVDDLCVIGVRV